MGTAMPVDSDLTGFHSSGMGVPTVSAARILKAQKNGKLGPETPLAMDKFPYLALAKVRAGWPQGTPHHRGGVGLGRLVAEKAPRGLGPELGTQGLVTIWVSVPERN